MALVDKLPSQDRTFAEVEPEIDNYVKTKTKFGQQPWFSGSSSAEIYFHPTDARVSGELGIWDGALYENTVTAVSAFRWRYSVSQYVHAARQWLEDHGEYQLASLTRISPGTLETAWVNAFQSDPDRSATVALPRFEGPLAFPTDNLAADVKTTDDVANFASFGRTKVSPRMVASIFAKHGEAVLTGPVTTVSSPTPGAKPVADLKSGTKLTVVGAESLNTNLAWLQVAAPGVIGTTFIPLSTPAEIETTNIGKPLKEIRVGKVAGSVEGVVDTAPAIDGLQQLRNAGRSIERISISTPKVENQDKRQLYILRVTYLMRAIRQQGVSRQRITVAGEDPELPDDQLRMRIFGN